MKYLHRLANALLFLRIFLADILSFLRAVLTPFVLLFAYLGEWRWAFVVLVAAWTTDLLDGLAARRFDPLRDRHPDFDTDGIADSVLAFGSSLVPVIYAVANTGWSSLISIGLISIYVLTIVSGLWMTTIMNQPWSPLNRWVIAFNMIVMHGIVQIMVVVYWFAYMAISNRLLLNCVFVAAVICGSMNADNKIRLWRSGRLQ